MDCTVFWPLKLPLHYDKKYNFYSVGFIYQTLTHIPPKRRLN